MRSKVKIITLLLAIKSLVGIDYPPAFLEKRIDLNNPAEALRLVRIMEIYPLLIGRVEEQEAIITEQSELLEGQEELLSDYDEENNYLRNQGDLLFWVAVIGIPAALLLGGGVGVYVGLMVK